MNDFDFLRNLPFGQYVLQEGPFQRIDCRARILSFALILVAITLTTQMAGLVLALVIILASMLIMRVSFRFALRGLIAPLPFLVILSVLQIFFNQNPDQGFQFFNIGTNTISMSDLAAGGTLLLRFSALILELTVASQTLSSSEITHGLESLLTPFKWLRMPVHDFVVIIQISLRFIPLLAQVAERIAKAQASRGVAWQKTGGSLINRVRLIIPLILPLFLTALRRAEIMALAMDARGYGINRQRTSLVRYRFGWRDAGFLLISTLCAALILFFPL